MICPSFNEERKITVEGFKTKKVKEDESPNGIVFLAEQYVGLFDNEFHGATEGKKLDLMRKNPKIFFSMECDIEPFSGQVACQYGTSYSSIMGKGIAEILENPEEKMAVHIDSKIQKTAC